jgi:enoyl-CoA hydratase/carnithine racemase
VSTSSPAATDLVSLRYDEHGARGRVARLTIERDAKLNTLNRETIAALTAAARQLQREDGRLRAVVLTGAGARAFVGGADIFAMVALDAAGARAFITALHEAIAAVRAIPVPVIARINGYCLGAGLELAAACDLRLASDNAVFGMPEVKVGIPSVIEAALLPGLIGKAKTTELVLLGENIDATAALACGLIGKRVPAADLDRATDAWVESLLAAGGQALRLQKALIAQWAALPDAQAIQAGIDSFEAAYRSDEPARLMADFVKRRR